MATSLIAPPRPPPGSSETARRLARVILKPVEVFLRIEASGGLVLLASAVAALVLANSRWAAAYHALWHVPLVLGAGDHVVRVPLELVINDGLMTIFFFVVGLEIRGEIHHGELSSPRKAILPVVAALGGMVVPALVYAAFNRGLPTAHGWGIPMATDIAFAVGVLTLLGRRVPAPVRVLLLALAIIDDIGAILVIAVFFSKGLALSGVILALAALAIIVLLRRFGVRAPLAYVPAGVALWLGFLQAGIHPTLAGVVLGLLTPAHAWYGLEGFVSTLREAGDRATADDRHRDRHEVAALVRSVRIAQTEALPPVERLQLALHPWVAYGIMPLFAFANSGVPLGGLDLRDVVVRPMALGIVLGLVLGKPVGIAVASFVAVRVRLAALPEGVRWSGVAVTGIVAGIGFTMAIFMAGLGIDDEAKLAAAKLCVLIASTVAGCAALLAGRVLLPSPPSRSAPEAARAAAPTR